MVKQEGWVADYQQEEVEEEVMEVVVEVCLETKEYE